MDQTLRSAIQSAVAAGDMPWAVRAAQDVLEREGHYQGYIALVTALLTGGKAAMAADYYAVLRDALPGDAAVAFGYGLALQRSDRLEAAIGQWKAALALAPDFADACRNIAMGLIDAGRDEEAAGYLERLRVLLPKDAGAPLHLGNIAFRRGGLADACSHYREALANDAGTIEAWINLGEAHRVLGRSRDAEACFRKVIALVPDARQAHFNLAALLLEQGRWREGFAEFQWRANLHHIPAELADLPLWTRAAGPLARVALWNDQGLGDAILFLRHARRLKTRVAHICAVLPAALTRLAATAPGIDEVRALGHPLPPLDYQLPLASLPHLLDEADPAAAWTGPYLTAAPRPGPPRRSVGLVWAASADSPNGKARSLSLDALAPLRDLAEIDWVCLQLAADAEIAASPWHGLLREMSPVPGDFADTAAIVAGLDLVISVDTAVAHLAGAMGKAVWILLARPCDWKWRAEGSTSLWYPTATLFRQDADRDWGKVVSAVADALRSAQAPSRHA